MEKMFLVIDESGAKGFWQNEEAHDGELGVVAGYLVPEAQLPSVKSGLKVIKNKVFTPGKLHITDLRSEDQELLRQEIYNYLDLMELYCVHNAIYVQGFHSTNQIVADLASSSKQKFRSKIHFANPKDKARMHSALFLGVFAKALAYCIDNDYGEVFKIDVITDNLDAKTITEFKIAARQLLELHKPETEEIDGYDDRGNNIATATITSSVTGDFELDDFSKVEFSISVEDSELTLCADVVCNSLHHHLRGRAQEGKIENLNALSALEGYGISSRFYGLREDDDSAWVHDSIFMHQDYKDG